MGEKIEVRRVATFEGAYVGSYLHKTNPDLPPQLGVLVELTGENAEVAKDVAQHIAAFAPTYVSRDEVPEDVVAKEREIAEATAKEEGKPEAALPKIVEGRSTASSRSRCCSSRRSPRTARRRSARCSRRPASSSPASRASRSARPTARDPRTARHEEAATREQ